MNQEKYIGMDVHQVLSRSYLTIVKGSSGGGNKAAEASGSRGRFVGNGQKDVH
jgi:hypothetical protein